MTNNIALLLIDVQKGFGQTLIQKSSHQKDGFLKYKSRVLHNHLVLFLKDYFIKSKKIRAVSKPFSYEGSNTYSGLYRPMPKQIRRQRAIAEQIIDLLQEQQ